MFTFEGGVLAVLCCLLCLVMFSPFYLLLFMDICVGYVFKVFFYEQDNLSFPLICADWNADEEMLLLEVIFHFSACA